MTAQVGFFQTFQERNEADTFRHVQGRREEQILLPVDRNHPGAIEAFVPGRLDDAQAAQRCPLLDPLCLDGAPDEGSAAGAAAWWKWATRFDIFVVKINKLWLPNCRNFNQCDQIWRNFATLAKIYTPLAKLLRVYLVFDNIFYLLCFSLL